MHKEKSTRVKLKNTSPLKTDRGEDDELAKVIKKDQPAR